MAPQACQRNRVAGMRDIPDLLPGQQNASNTSAWLEPMDEVESAQCFVCGEADDPANLSEIDDIRLCGSCAKDMVKEL